jgi:hypothetical protein
MVLWWSWWRGSVIWHAVNDSWTGIAYPLDGSELVVVIGAGLLFLDVEDDTAPPTPPPTPAAMITRSIARTIKNILRVNPHIFPLFAGGPSALGACSRSPAVTDSEGRDPSAGTTVLGALS